MNNFQYNEHLGLENEEFSELSHRELLILKNYSGSSDCPSRTDFTVDVWKFSRAFMFTNQ